MERTVEGKSVLNHKNRTKKEDEEDEEDEEELSHEAHRKTKKNTYRRRGLFSIIYDFSR